MGDVFDALKKDCLPTAFVSSDQLRRRIETPWAVQQRIELTKRPDATALPARSNSASATRGQGAKGKSPEEEKEEEEEKKEEEEGEEASDSAESDLLSELDDALALPISHEILLKDHKKTVSALDIDPSGSRLVSGGYDYAVKFWDFHGMDAGFRPFRSQEPCGDYSIEDVRFSPHSGDKILVIPNSAQAKIMTRDGHTVAETAKGDQYLMDMKHTKGHVSAMHSGSWHPTHRDIFMTTGSDSTLRIWNLAAKDGLKHHTDILVHKSRVPGGKSPITRALYSPVDGGATIIAAAMDGTIRLWAQGAAASQYRPALEVTHAHTPGHAITSLALSKTRSLLASRSMDHTLKFWDLRNLKAPLRVHVGLANEHKGTEVCFSPDESLLLAAVSADPRPDGAPSRLLLYDTASLEQKHQLSLSQTASVIRVVWHAQLNQIAASKSDGSISVLYSPNLSTKGATLCLSKGSARREFSFVDEVSQPIYTPHALPLFKDSESRSLKRMREKERLTALKAYLPELPVSGAGKGGKIGSGVTQHILKNIIRDNTREEDPREALLKYAKLAEEEPRFIAPAYKKTQPKTIFSKEIDDQDEPADADK